MSSLTKSMKQSAPEKALRAKRGAQRKDIMLLTCMLLPSFIYYIVFHYLPMCGIVIAFKDYTYSGGMFGSDWNGFKNFEYFFTSTDAWVITRNTILYNLVAIVSTVTTNVAIALVLFEVSSRKALKYYQTTMLLPNFMSWVVVSYITYALFDYDYGVINHMFGTDINFYAEPVYWPFILSFVNVWKGIGMGSVMYYAALMGIDTELFEAAKIDGANKWQQIWHISIPSLKNIMAVLIIMGTGNIFRGDFGLFYQIPMDVGNLYSVTDVIDTYVYRGLSGGEYGSTAAVGLFQSVVGLFTIICANSVVKKISPESAMF